MQNWTEKLDAAIVEWIDHMEHGRIVKAEHAARRARKAARMVEQESRRPAAGYPYQTRDRRWTLNR